MKPTTAARTVMLRVDTVRVWVASCARQTAFIVIAASAVPLMAAACNTDASNGAAVPEQVPAAAPPLAVSFDTATAYVRGADTTHTLRVEVADREAQRAYGLMDRDVLADDAGMIFLYDQQQHGGAGFWMYRTRIPLDIAYFDGAGRIVAIRQMEPCPVQDELRCQALAAGYAPGVPYYGALEVNQGWFAARNIDVGDHIVLPDRVGG